MKIRLREFVLAISLLVSAAVAQAAVVDFNSHPADFGNPIFDSGFTFNTTASGWGVFNGSGEACCSVNGHPDGSRSLFANGDSGGSNANTVMSLTAGGTFSVFGFDGASYWSGASGTLNVIGTFLDASTITTSFQVNSQWQTFSLSGYSSLVSLKFQDSQSGGFLSAPGFGVDNIQLSAPVPEPEIYAMMGFGLGFLGWVGRRRKQQAA